MAQESFLTNARTETPRDQGNDDSHHIPHTAKDSPDWVGEPNIMEFSASGAGTFVKQEHEKDMDISTLQGRLSETRLSDASLFDDTFFDSVMRESLDGPTRERESFDGGIKMEGMGARSSVDGNYGRGSLDCGYRGSLDMRGSLDIRSMDLPSRSSIDQGYMGPGFEASIMRELGNIEESPTTVVGMGDGQMPPPSMHCMTGYSCAQAPLMQPPPQKTMGKDGSQLTMLHQQQQPPPNFMGGVYSPSQFIINPVSASMPQQSMAHFMPMPQGSLSQNSMSTAFPTTMQNILSGIMKKPTSSSSSSNSTPETQAPKRPSKKKSDSSKSSKGSNQSQSAQGISHDCNNSAAAASTKTSSYRGVSKASTNSWGAKFSGKRIKSTCKSEQEAAEVYDDFLRKHRPDLFVKLANFCPQCGADRVRGPQCVCFNDVNSIC